MAVVVMRTALGPPSENDYRTIIAQLTWTLTLIQTLIHALPRQFAYVTLQFIEADQPSRRQAWFKAVLSKHG
jgi:hypothetical protein